MKKIVCVLFIGFYLTACQEAKQEAEGPKNTDLIGQNLKGMVQQIEETNYKVDSTGKIGEMDSCCAYIQEYDEKGYSPKNYRKDNKGNLKGESSMQHHENGQMKEFVGLKDGKKQNSVSIEIGKDGKYVSAKSYDSTGKMDGYYSDLQENEYGALTGGKMYNMDSTLKFTFTSSFDKAINIGNRTDSAGKTLYENKLTLNEKGDVVEMNSTSLSKDSTIQDKETYTYESYDEMGNWTQRTTYDKNGKATKITKRTITYYKKD